MRAYLTRKSFWARVYKDARSILGGEKCEHEKRIEVAYGSASQTMSSHGRGEVSVPVGGAYVACVKKFGKKNVTIEDENNTTKKSWETQQTKELAYKRYKEDGTHILDHTRGKRPPLLRPEDIDAWNAHRERTNKRSQLRKSWNSKFETKKTESGNTEEKTEDRYIECRGLRICPERRIYQDRDVSSARAIAGLRCLTLRGKGHPTAFRRANYGI
jgi:hypothetical protein